VGLSPQEDAQMKTVIILAMHGSPPKDFPKAQVALVVGLHMWLERASGPVLAMIERYHTRLDARIRTWPRTAENDPFHTASQELAAQLSQETGCEVIVGYNEFCAPSLDQALDQAAVQRAERIIVVTPMMTPGGEHAEEDIPESIQHARERHPGTTFVYAWPFKVEDVAQFLAIQVEQIS
jgi:sirohydrochlorin cobaltochelatase